MAEKTKVEKKKYVDPGWPQDLPEGKHAVTEVIADKAGALSPYGDIDFPIPVDQIPYVHPFTVVNQSK